MEIIRHNLEGKGACHADSDLGKEHFGQEQQAPNP